MTIMSTSQVDFVVKCEREDNANLLNLIQEFVLSNSEDMEDIMYIVFDICIRKGNVQAVEFLIHYGVDPSADYFGLIYACQYGQYEIFKLLIDNGAVIGQLPTVLMILSASAGCVEILDYFFTLGYDLTISNNVVMITAALSTQEDVVRYLISKGISPNCQNNIIVKKACEENNIAVLNMFLRLGLRIDEHGIVSLCYACHLGHIEIIKLLLQNGVCPKQANLIAFHVCIDNERRDSLEALLDSAPEPLTDEQLQNLVAYAKPLTICSLFLRQRMGLSLDTLFPEDISVSEDCPVCLETASLILPCRHSICNTCFLHLTTKTCPVCRLIYDQRYIKRMIKH